VDLAGRNDVYSGSWSGPPPSTYNYNDGIAAGDLLLAGLAIGNGTSTSTSPPGGSSPTSSPSQTSPPSPMHKGVSSGAIAGGVVGGVAMIVLLVLLLLLIRRRRRYSTVKETAMTDIDDCTSVRGTATASAIPTTFQAEPYRVPDWPPREVGTPKRPPNSVPSTVSSVPPSISAPTSTSAPTAGSAFICREEYFFARSRSSDVTESDSSA
jgi:hypothetical protein